MRYLVTLALLLLTTAVRAQPVSAVVAALAGTATVTMPDSPAVPLLVGQSVREGAVVQTGAESRLRLQLADNTALTLGPESALRLDHFSPAGDPSPSRFAHLFGYLRAVVTPQHGQRGLEISTASEVAAVRGTVWLQHADPASTDLFVAVGHVALRGTGGAVTLAPGEGVTYRTGAPHSPVRHWAAAKIATFDAATRPP